MLSSGHDVADAHINKQHLWLPIQDQAIQNSSVDGGGLLVLAHN